MKKILSLILLISLAYSCNKDFGDLNVDTKNPSSVPPGTLFAFGEKSMVDLMTSSNVNLNIFRMLAQQWTETTYIDEANWDLNTRSIPQNFWNSAYLNVLKSMDECGKLIPEQSSVVTAAQKANQTACVEIVSVYMYSTLVNTFGDIPYSEALDFTNLQPKYDDAATVYNDLATRLDAAINSIDTGVDGFGSQDILFGGDMGRWKTFANSLKMRMGITIYDADATRAKRMIEEASAGAIQDNSENCVFQYLSSPPNTNPIWVDLVQSGRKDFVSANTLVDFMNGLNDPRVPLYFTVDANGGFTGGPYGDNNNYSTYSKPANTILAPDFGATLFSYAEMEFIRAEAVQLNMNVGGTVESHYNAGVTASIEEWGGSGADAATYLGQLDVAYATAPGTWKDKIGSQKWIALYNRGFEAWTEIRRLDAPAMKTPADAQSGYPVRYTYPVQEQNLNTTNYNAAASAIGGDKVETKLFWDKN